MKNIPTVSHTVLQDPHTKEYHININIRVKTTEETPSIDTFLQSITTNFKETYPFKNPFLDKNLLTSPNTKGFSFLSSADIGCLKSDHLPSYSPNSYL